MPYYFTTRNACTLIKTEKCLSNAYMNSVSLIYLRVVQLRLCSEAETFISVLNLATQRVQGLIRHHSYVVYR